MNWYKNAQQIAKTPWHDSAIEQIMYHGTSDKFLSSIESFGLSNFEPSHSYDQMMERIGGIYLTKIFQLAAAYGYSAAEKRGGNPIVLSVNIRNLNDSEFVPDPEYGTIVDNDGSEIMPAPDVAVSNNDIDKYIISEVFVLPRERWRNGKTSIQPEEVKIRYPFNATLG